ncbi:MAG: histidine--tRNA ligase [Thermotogae bacterium]|nr:histidine--tRNA ligase [Thermotogota bacterium]
MKKPRALRGFRDIYSEEWEKFWSIYETFRERLDLFNFSWIETPILERLSLFVRSVGEETDIVQKQMFSFKDRGGREVVLRPEGTAGVVRAFIERGMVPPKKLAYFGPMFRAERPQKGRYRQFYQIGAEFIGFSGYLSDVEGVLAAYLPLRDLGLEVEVRINTLGNVDTKNRYAEALKNYLEGMDDLCEDCKRRRERNPLRVLDCKIDGPRLNPPDILDFLSEEERHNFERTLKKLAEMGIPIVRDPNLVRGLDYYTGIVFEMVAKDLEAAQSTILAGGRYDNLIADLGGKPTPALGWAAGVDRIALLYKGKTKRRPLYFVVRTSHELKEFAFEILVRLREEGKRADMLYEDRSLKAQMRHAHRSGARWVVIVGEEEYVRGMYRLKDMETGEESLVPL